MAASMRVAACSKLLQNFAKNTCRSCGQSLNLTSNGSSKFYSTRTFTRSANQRLGWATAGVVSVVAFGVYVYKRQQLQVLPSVAAVTLVEELDDKSEKGPLRLRYNFIADVVEKAAPAVVHIEIQGRHPFSRQAIPMSNGSGFIVREDGIVLTNAHVVANKQQVVVKLHDGRTFQGLVQAVDPVSDLATVKINATGLPTIRLGKSSSVRPGEFVVALGSPFQLNNTVTSGIISSVQRGSKELGLHNKDMDYIQTDAVINFGNSGGPLVNLDGEAIGINTMKVTTGISFAIPSDYAQNFLDKARSIEKRGSDSRGWFGSGGVTRPKRRYMGITMLTLTPSIINELRSRHDPQFPDISNGVLVHKVVVGSPAFDGGLQPGDVITHINSAEIKSSSDIYKIVEDQSELRMTVRRGSNSVNLTVIAEEVM